MWNSWKSKIFPSKNREITGGKAQQNLGYFFQDQKTHKKSNTFVFPLDVLSHPPTTMWSCCEGQIRAFGKPGKKLSNPSHGVSPIPIQALRGSSYVEKIVAIGAWQRKDRHRGEPQEVIHAGVEGHQQLFVVGEGRP